jgi:type II secretory pathway predicted ATPase ExeA
MVPEKDAQTRVMVNPTLAPAEFLELLLLSFGVRDLPASKAQRLILIEDLLTKAHRAGKATVLIIDEAHKLNFDVLEEIRLLMNFETSEQKLLQIVLAGQPELDDLLNRPELWQLKQRVAIRLQIEPFTREQVGEYLLHRWTRIGGADTLPFDAEAISLISEQSCGIPRLINSICDNALLLAYSNGSHVLNAKHILEVVRDLDLRPAGDGVRQTRTLGTDVHTKPAEPASAPAHIEPVEPRRLEVEVTRQVEPAPKAIEVTNKMPGTAQDANHVDPQLAGKQSKPLQLDTLARYMPEQSKSFFLRRWTARLRA